MSLSEAMGSLAVRTLWAVALFIESVITPITSVAARSLCAVAREIESATLLSESERVRFFGFNRVRLSVSPARASVPVRTLCDVVRVIVSDGAERLSVPVLGCRDVRVRVSEIAPSESVAVSEYACV